MLNFGIMPQASTPEPQPLAVASPADAADRKQGRWLLAIAIFAAIAIYLPSVWFGAVYDDHTLLMSNTLIRSWSKIPFFFTHQIFANLDPNAGGGYYRPLAMAVIIATAKLLGVHIWAFHLASVVLFLLVIPTVFFVTRALEFNAAIAGWAALLFAVHPLHIEVVAWATALQESLAALFFLLAIAFYARSQRLASWRPFSLSAAMYGLALLSKEFALVMPGLALLLELIRPPSRKRLAAARIAILFGITVTYLALRVKILGEVTPHAIPLSWQTTFLTIPSLLLFYFRQLIAPVNVSLFYDAYYVESWRSMDLFIPCGVVILVIFLSLFAVRRKWMSAGEIFCALAALVCFAPIFDLRALPWREFVHDRYAYLASIFFVIFLASLISRLAKAKTIILACYAVFLATQCEAQVWTYKDEFSLFAHACVVAPNNANALGRMATLLYQHGHPAEAKQMLLHVVQIAPMWWSAHYDLAQYEFRDGNLAEAERVLRQAIALEPGHAQEHFLMAEILKREGHYDEAAKETALAQALPHN